MPTNGSICAPARGRNKYIVQTEGDRSWMK